MASASGEIDIENAEVRVSQPEVERDANFYFDDDLMAIFLVENKLFRVHRRYFIKMSQTFRDMFSTANIREGETDDKPISLPGVTRHEFETLLKFFYSLPHVLGESPIVFPGVIKFTLEEKLALLSISHRFLFDDIFRFILQQVQPPSIPVVERIRLGDKYNIPEWLSSAYTALLNRSPGELSPEEAKVLGSKRVAYLYKAKCCMHQEHLKKASQPPMNNGSEGNGPRKKSNRDSFLAWLIVIALCFFAAKIATSKA